MIDHWFWKYALENKGVYIQAGIATLLVNVFALVIGFFVMVVYDRIIPSNATTSLLGLFIGASVIIVLRYILELLKTYFLDYAGQRIEKKTSESVFDKIMRYDLLRAPKSNGSVASLVIPVVQAMAWDSTACRQKLLDITIRKDLQEETRMGAFDKI